jgi:hypothetical protein
MVTEALHMALAGLYAAIAAAVPLALGRVLPLAP